MRGVLTVALELTGESLISVYRSGNNAMSVSMLICHTAPHICCLLCILSLACVATILNPQVGAILYLGNRFIKHVLIDIYRTVSGRERSLNWQNRFHLNFTSPSGRLQNDAFYDALKFKDSSTRSDCSKLGITSVSLWCWPICSPIKASSHRRASDGCVVVPPVMPAPARQVCKSVGVQAPPRSNVCGPVVIERPTF